MTDLLIYLLKVAIIQMVMVGFYGLVLRNLKQFRLNRIFLLGSLILAAGLPLIQISIPETEVLKPLAGVWEQPLGLEEYVVWERVSDYSQHAKLPVNWWLVGYCAIVSILLIRYVKQLWSILTIKKKEVTLKKHVQRNVHLTAYRQSFSIFRQIYIPRELVGTAEYEKILMHEYQHVRLGHSWDRVLMEVFIVLLWFNPFMYLMRRYLIENHEFEADQATLDRIGDKLMYQLALVSLATRPLQLRWISAFAMSNTKRRILMMNQLNTRNTYWKNILFIPILLLIVGLFSFRWESPVVKRLEGSWVTTSMEEALDFRSLLVQVENEIPSILPVKMEDITVRLSSTFGKRKNPLKDEMQWHQGIDIAAPIGTAVIATADGRVKDISNTPKGYGKMVILEHKDGLVTRYAHLDGFNVKEDDLVKKGDVIGYVGNTGLSMAPHLHYEVMKDDKNVNPALYIKDFQVK